MTTMNTASDDEFQCMADDMTERLRPAILEFARAHRLSGLSVNALAVVVLMASLRELGGLSAVTWLKVRAEALAPQSDKDMDRLERRSRQAMDRMGHHFDMVLAMAGGRAQ